MNGFGCAQTWGFHLEFCILIILSAEYVDKPCMQWTGVPNFEVPPSMVVASNRWVSSAITTIATGHRLQVNPAVFFRHTIYGWLYGYIIIYIHIYVYNTTI